MVGQSRMDLRVRGRGQDESGSGQGLVACFCEYGNEPSGSIKKAGYCLTS